MRRAALPYLSMIAFLAILHAQVFGLCHRYLCTVNGVTIETVAEHHHEGDGLESGHLANYVPHHHGDESGDESGTEHHTPVKIDLKAPRAAAPVHVPAYLSVIAMELPKFFTVPDLGEMLGSEPHRAFTSEEARSRRPGCWQTSTCVVMLL